MQLNLFKFADPLTVPPPRNDVNVLGCRDCMRYYYLKCPKGRFWLAGVKEGKCRFQRKTVPANIGFNYEILV